MEYSYRSNERYFWSQVIANIRNRWWIYLVILVQCCFIGWLLSSYLITPVYQSDATMIVNVREENGAAITSEQISSAEELANLYGVIIKSDTVLDLVIDNLDLEMNYEQLAKNVSVSSVNNTSVIKISVTDTNAKRSMKILRQIVKTAPGVIEKTVEAGSVKVVSEPRLQTEPVSPNKMQYMLMSVLLALMVIAAWILMSVAREDRIVSRKDIEDRLGLRIAGEIPAVAVDRKKEEVTGRKGNILSEDSSFSYREAFQYLQMTLSQQMQKNHKKTILVTSAVAGEGKSSVAINLALSLKSESKKVLLLECDLRRPSISNYLGIMDEGNQGLEGVLKGTITFHKALQHHDGVSILPAGGTSTNPTEMLNSNRMKVLIDVLKDSFDFIVIDTPPAEEMADALSLCPLVDGVLFVIRHDYADFKVIDVAVRKLQHAGTEIYGVVLNGEKKSHRKKYGYEYSYGYE